MARIDSARCRQTEKTLHIPVGHTAFSPVFRKLHAGELLAHERQSYAQAIAVIVCVGEFLFAAILFAVMLLAAILLAAMLLANELLEIEVAVEIGFHVDLVPCHSCEMYAEEALCVQLLLAVLTVYDIYVAGALGCDLIEFCDIGSRYELDFVKIFAVADHSMHSFQNPETGEMSIHPVLTLENVLSAIGSVSVEVDASSDAMRFLSSFPFSFDTYIILQIPGKSIGFASILPYDRTACFMRKAIVQCVYFAVHNLYALHNYSCRDRHFARESPGFAPVHTPAIPWDGFWRRARQGVRKTGRL